MDDQNDDLVAVDRPILVDFQGNDALAQSHIQIKTKVRHYATACLPMLLRKAMYVIQNSKNQKSVIQAMKFVKTLSQGQFEPKTIQSAAKKLTDEQIAKLLNGSQSD